MLTFTGVRKNYGAHLIFDIPKTTISEGIYWLNGQNGAGKSTLMKVIAGMIPFEGELELFNTNLQRQPLQYRRLVNYVEAEPLYPPFVSGMDLIQFFISARNAPAEKVAELQAHFGINDFVNNSVGTYSSGMVKKLSLVLAFTGQPKLILLDEPLVTIDKETVPVLYSLISEYNRLGTSFILASHQPLDATQLPAIKELSLKDRQLLPV